MDWIRPEIEEIKMDAEIGSYQEDRETHEPDGWVGDDDHPES
jgi:hypothetical protein